MKPLKTYSLPIEIQNKFGSVRKYDIHTGVDLFTFEDDNVYSMYDGVVTAVIEFTGYSESPWWDDTLAIMIFHPEINRTFLYGEISTNIKVGKFIKEEQFIGTVKRVLKNDKGKPTTMLHMECYKGLQTKCVWWNLNTPCPKKLEDITKYL